MRVSKEMLKGIVIGLLISVLLLGGSLSVYGATQMSRIDVTFGNIKVFLDDRLLSLKDATGAIVQPMMYNGTTYLPVRAISEALDKAVTWEESTSSIYLGKHDTENVANMLHFIEPIQSDGGTAYGLMNREFAEDNYGNAYNYALVHHYYSGTKQALSAVYNLEGKYSRMKGNFFIQKGTKEGKGRFIVREGNNVLYMSPELDVTMDPIEFDIDLKYADIIKITIFVESGDQTESFAIGDVKLYQ